MTTLEERIDAYRAQAAGKPPTPAQRRRAIKKARRDLLNWRKGASEPENQGPDAEQPSDETFIVAGVGETFAWPSQGRFTAKRTGWYSVTGAVQPGLRMRSDKGEPAPVLGNVLNDLIKGIKEKP